MMMMMMMMMMFRLVVACVFSGLSLNVSNLGGDVYLNFF